MKKDRNCNMNVYPGMMGGMNMPMMGSYGQMMGMPMMGGSMPTTNTQNNYGNDLGSLTSQVNALEQRINRLESIVNGSGYSTNYNPNNYQMM